jgi:signal transduction histidine kinase
MARELHDVLAHSITVMVVQAEAAEDVLEQQPQRAREALQRVQASGRAALHEARAVLATLRDREPGAQAAPGLADLEALLDEARTAGLSVQLDVHGEPSALPSGKDVAAYRIVQEALTNVLKHANATRAEVTIRHRPDVLELEISDDGTRSPLTDRSRSGSLPGLGLAGMRERVALYGGELQTGHHDGQGFVVRARIPVDTAPT